MWVACLGKVKFSEWSSSAAARFDSAPWSELPLVSALICGGCFLPSNLSELEASQPGLKMVPLRRTKLRTGPYIEAAETMDDGQPY